MPPTKATLQKVAPSGASVVTSTPSKPGSPNAHVASSNTMASTSTMSPENISNPHELTAFVETVLKELEDKFDETSTQVLDRMSQMSSRLDSLENSIQELLNEEMSTPSSPRHNTPVIKAQSLRGNTH